MLGGDQDLVFTFSNSALKSAVGSFYETESKIWASLVRLGSLEFMNLWYFL